MQVNMNQWRIDFKDMYRDGPTAERALQEIEFALLYQSRFNHGTSGHMEYTVIANLARLLDGAYDHIERLNHQINHTD